MSDTKNHLYFWLGEDGKLTEETASTFQNKIDDLEERFRKWRDVIIDTDDEDEDTRI